MFDSWQIYTLDDNTKNYRIIDYSANPSRLNRVHEVNLAVNIRQETSFYLYNSTTNWYGYQNIDITDWVYPRYSTYLTNWGMELPDFTIQNSYNINIGNNMQKIKTFAPFTHCK